MIPLDGPYFDATTLRFTVASPPGTTLRFAPNPFGFSGRTADGSPTVLAMTPRPALVMGAFGVTDDMGVAFVEVAFIALGSGGGDGIRLTRAGAAWGFGGDDTMLGSEGGDFLFGGAGENRLFGYGGNDQLFGGDAFDIMNGGDGNDFVDGGGDGDQLLGGAGDDTIVGGDGNDELWSGTGNDRLSGGGGIDLLVGQGGADTMDAGDANDYLYGMDGNDAGNGDAGDDFVFGHAGADSLTGGAGNDFLHGGTDADHLSGGDGHDKLVGAESDDELHGGAGDDLFVFQASRAQNGVDHVLDFTPGEDFLITSRFATRLRWLDGALDGGRADAFDFNPFLSLDQRFVKVLDLPGGQDLATATGMQDALDNGGEYDAFDLSPGAKAVLFSAASAASGTGTMFYLTGGPSGSIGPRVEMIAVIDFAAGSDFSLLGA